MKTIRKILLVATLSTIVFMTLFAGKCAEEYTVETLTATTKEIDLFLDEFGKTYYKFRADEGWLLGIIIYKDWVDSVQDGALLSAYIKVRTQDKQTREIYVGKTSHRMTLDRPAHKKFDSLRVGDLIAFAENWDFSGLEKMSDSSLRVVMKNTETKFMQVHRTQIDLK